MDQVGIISSVDAVVSALIGAILGVVDLLACCSPP